VGLIIGAGVVYGLGLSSSSGTTKTVTTTASGSSGGLSGTVTIGVLTDLSDGLSSEGVKVQAYTQQAATDINAWLQTTQWAGKVTFAVDPVDYKLDATTAGQELSTFASQGVSVVVGPLNSGATGAILNAANTDHVVLLSPSSTSPALSVSNDYLYRTAPTDVYQGAADARTMYQQGVRGLIIVYRDDTYGDGLFNYTMAKFNTIGGSGVTVDAVPYAASGGVNFGPVAQTINTDYQALVSKYGADAVAIQAISFEEVGYLLDAVQASYPTLLQTHQPWFGSDGEQGDENLVNSTYASLMTQVELVSSVFGYTTSAKTTALCQQFAGQSSLSCDSYSLGSYDDVWLAALSILDCGANSGPCVQQVLPSVASNYYGVTGWTGLTSAGDRLGGDFQFWCVLPSSSGGAQWTLCGAWSAGTDTTTWVSGLQPRT
jgi:branched-chain amino acid transport system substrate-binding protein